MSKDFILTISREFGSGGHSIGAKVAKELDVPFYDQGLIDEIAKRSGYDLDFVKAMDEAEIPSGNRFTSFFAGRDVSGKSIQDYLFDEECKIIEELADQGSFVVVGRCSDYILRDRENCIDVYTFASMEKRIARILERYGTTNVPIEKRIMDKDKRRAARYTYHTKRDWGVMSNYDICFDTGRLGVDNCADLIIDHIRRNYGG